MKLSDLFKPRWKSSDPNVRLKSVSSIKDTKILENMALNDKDIRVRLEAARKSGNQKALYGIAEYDDIHEEYGLEALKHILDERLIAALALIKPGYFNPELKVKIEALKLI